MDWNKMSKDIRFGFIDSKDNFRVKAFKREFLNYNEDKFVQLQIEGVDYIRVGDLYHRRILRETLNQFGLKYDTKSNRAGFEMPLFRGYNYNLVGAGKIVNKDDKLNFYDCSSDYFKDVRGTNKENLENIFGKENIIEGEKFLGCHSFFVNYL